MSRAYCAGQCARTQATCMNLHGMMHGRAPVAQLDRAPDFESVGRRFESCRARFSIFGSIPKSLTEVFGPTPSTSVEERQFARGRPRFRVSPVQFDEKDRLIPRGARLCCAAAIGRWSPTRRWQHDSFDAILVSVRPTMRTPSAPSGSLPPRPHRRRLRARRASRSRKSQSPRPRVHISPWKSRHRPRQADR